MMYNQDKNIKVPVGATNIMKGTKRRRGNLLTIIGEDEKTTRLPCRRSSSTGDIENDVFSPSSSSCFIKSTSGGETKMPNGVSLIPVTDSTESTRGGNTMLRRRISRSFNDLLSLSSNESLSHPSGFRHGTRHFTLKREPPCEKPVIDKKVVESGLTPVVTNHINLCLEKSLEKNDKFASADARKQRKQRRSSFAFDGGATRSFGSRNKRRKIDPSNSTANDTFYSGSESCSSDDELREMECLRYKSSPTGTTTLDRSNTRKNTLVEESFQKQAQEHLQRIREARKKMMVSEKKSTSEESREMNKKASSASQSAFSILHQSPAGETGRTLFTESQKEILRRACDELRRYSEGETDRCLSFHPLMGSKHTQAIPTSQASNRVDGIPLTFKDVEKECVNDLFKVGAHLGMATMLVAVTAASFL